VETVKAEIIKSNPSQLQVTANGETRTSNWTQIQLQPVVYVRPPPDGIQDYEFIGVPPSGISQPTVTSVSATHVMQKPAWVIGVRVRAETNARAVKI
jgi:hypothetical protein